MTMGIKTDEEIRKEVNELFGQHPILQDLLREAKEQAAGKKQETGDSKKENELDIFECSLNEFYIVLSLIEGHMDRLFDEMSCIAGLVGKFSSDLHRSEVDVEELERQVGVIKTLINGVVGRVNILCENGIKDLNSQLDIIRIKRSY